MTPSYIVDAHHHLWDLAAVDYPWLQQRGVRRFFGDPTAIQQNYGVGEFRSDQGSIDVRKSVHIQVGTAPATEVHETSWLQAQAEAQGLPTAIVAFCDLTAANAPAVIQRHMQASPRLRGVRQIVSRHQDEDRLAAGPYLLTDATAANNLALLASLGLSFDLQLTPPHMLVAARLLENTPDLRVALCHAGSPWRQDAEGLADWCRGLKALVDMPTMVCKLSGLGMFDPHWTAERLRPIVLTVLEIFGPSRVMWGSNFPVDKLYRGYEELFWAIHSIVPSEMRERVFRTTAERFYRI